MPYQGAGGLAAWVAAPFWALARGLTTLLSPKAPRKPAATSYEGAVHSRLTMDWVLAPILSANQEVQGDHRNLVRRSRELARNDAHNRRFLGLLEVNIVGAHGIRLQAQVRDTAGDLDREANRIIETAFADWSRPENCTVDGRLSFAEVQRADVRGKARDGEALIRMVPGFDNPYGFALQLIDPDQLDIDHNRTAGAGRNEIVHGVERDRWGRPVAYHLWTDHPSEHGRSRQRIRVPASQMIHHFQQDRPGQVRGVPRAAPILMSNRMLHAYREAEVVAARTASSQMGFFEVDPEAADDPTGIGAREDLEVEVEPGKFQELPPGRKFVAWSPEHPTTAYEAFERALLRTMATGLDVSYASLSGDLSDVNYSSIRAGLLVERDFYRAAQKDLADQVLARIYREWIRWAVTTGAVALPATRLRDLTAHTWRARGWPWVDPEKDVKAAVLAIQNKLDSRTRVVAEQGRDFEEVLEELSEESDLAEEYGIDLAAVAEPADPAAPDTPGSWEFEPNGLAPARIHWRPSA